MAGAHLLRQALAEESIVQNVWNLFFRKNSEVMHGSGSMTKRFDIYYLFMQKWGFKLQNYLKFHF